MENREIEKDEVIYDSILFDFMNIDIKIGDEYIINITSIIFTPEYDKFITLYDKKYEYGEDYSIHYNTFKFSFLNSAKWNFQKQYN